MSGDILTTVDDLFVNHKFTIPNYQRSYAWEEEQLEAFVDDLRHQINTQTVEVKKPYFIGTLLLHGKGTQGSCLLVDVVDGQQRLTTLLTFIATALLQGVELEDADEIQQNYICHSSLGQKFQTISVDNACFRASVLKIDDFEEAANTLSAKKLMFARDYFKTNIKTQEWQPMISLLRHAQVLAYVIDDLATATQIFEFQNDRGKKLSHLEVVKSFLMHTVHLNCSNDTETKLETMHSNFESIFRAIEELDSYPRSPSEDNILAYFCAGYFNWVDSEYLKPKKLIKKKLLQIEPEGPQALIKWISQLVFDLKQCYNNILTIYKKIDSYQAFSNLLVLNRLALFWPILIKTYQVDTSSEKKDFKKICHLLEVFCLRAYGLASLRANAGQSHLLWVAKKFNLVDTIKYDFHWLFNELVLMSSWWNISKRMAINLQNAHFYHNHKQAALYILWRYENYLREGNEGQNKWPKLSWREVVAPNNHAEKLSLEHIAAQNGLLSKQIVCWNETDKLEEFKEVALHKLGNLVIDTISSNSSKKDDEFDDKWRKFSESSTYLSQGELKRFIPEKINDWALDAIKKRQGSLTQFVEKTWCPPFF